MASNDRYINIGMGLDIQDLRTGLTSAKNEISLAESEFKRNTAGLDKWNTSIDGLTQKLVYMATELSAKKGMVDAYADELERVINAYGAESQEAVKAQTRLNNAQAAYSNAEAYVESLKEKLDELRSSDDLASKSTTDLKSSVKKLSKQVQDQRDKVAETTRKLEEAKKEYGEDSKQARKLTSTLKTQQTQLGYMEDALGDYKDALNSAKSASKNTTSYTTKLTTALGKMKSACKIAIKNGVSKLKESLGDLGRNALSGIKNAVVDFAKQTIQLGMSFSDTMATVRANSKASDEEMELLEKTAREFGATTTFSANEAAQALNSMSLAGWKAEQSSEALGGVLSLAAASGMELGDAAEVVTKTLSAFGMQASQSGHLADLLAYAQSNSNTTATEMGEAYSKAAAKMKGAGQTVETTTALLMAMANQGTGGSEAATALTAVVRDMTAKMKDGSIRIGEASVKVKDAKGNFRSLVSVLGDVQKAIKGMGSADQQAALMTTFTSTSMTALSEILGEGVDKVKGYEKALKESDGTAKEMADTMNDTLGGDMKALNSAIEDVQLRIYDCLEGPLRGVVQFITDAIPKLVEFCEEVYNFFVKLYDDLQPLWDALKEFADWCGKIGALVGQAIGDIAEEMGKHEGEFKTFGKATVDAIEEPWETAPGFFGDIWGASKKTFSDDTGTVKTIGMSLVKGFTSDAGWNGVVGFFGDIWDGITSKFDEKVEPLKKAGEGLYKAFTTAWDGASSWAGGVLEKVKGALSDPLGTIKGVSTTLYTKFTTVWDTASSWAGDVLKAIKGGLSDPLSTIKGASEGLFGKFKSAWDTVSSWAGGKFEDIKKAFSDPLGTMRSKGEALWNAIKSPFEDVYNWFKTNVYDKVVGVFRPILQFFGIGGEASDPLAETKRQIEEAEKAYKTATDAYNTAYSSWTEVRRRDGYGTSAERNAYNVYTAKQTAYQQARNYLDGLKKGLEEQEAKVGSEGIGGIKTSIQDAFSGIENVITKPFTDAWNTITGTFGKIGAWFQDNVVKPIQDALKPVGEAVTGGVVGGMTDAKKGIATGTQTLGGWIVGGLCDVLGIHSPSKVMHDRVGLMIGAGVAEGIADSARSVRAASEALGASVSIGGGRSGGQAVRGPATVVYNQTINSPDPVSVGQIYRDTRSLIGRREWA